MGEAMDRESNSTTRDPIRAAGAPGPRGNGRPVLRAPHRLHGLLITVGASLVLWVGIVIVVWLVATALT